MMRFRVLRMLLVAIAVVVGLGLLGILAIHVYGAHRLADVTRRYESEVGPLAVRAFMRPKVAVEQNAVTWQRPGVLAAVFFPGDQALVGTLATKRFADWAADDIPKLEAILARNEPAIELLERARGMKTSNWDIPYEDGTTAKIPNLLAAMNVSKLLGARGRLALGQGDRETAIASAETLGALARSHEAESATIVLLIGVAIEKLQLGLVHELATSAPTTPSELDRLDASMCEEDLTHAVRQTIRGGAAAIVHDVGSGSLLADVHVALHRRVARALSDLVAAVAIESHRAADKEVGAPVREPLNDAGSEDRHGGWWKRLGDIYAPNAASISARASATASARQLARLAIALRREALVAGRYPATLPVIDGMPTDDPLTGGPRVYDVRADGSAQLHATTTEPIIRSIFPVGQPVFEGLYRFTLPAPRGGG